MKNTSVFRIGITTLLVSMMWMPGTAVYAQSVPERGQTPALVQGTWHSPPGRTTVTLDADVIVHEVTSMPLVEVFPRIFEPQEAHALADALIGKGEWQAYINFGSDNQRLDDSPQPGYQTGTWDGNNLQFHDIRLGGGGIGAYNLPLKSVSASYTDAGFLGKAPAMVGLSYQFKPGDNLGRQVGTPEDAAAMAAKVILGIWPDFQVQAIDKDLDNLSYRVSSEGKSADYGYRVYFARVLRGVLVTPVMQQGAGDSSYFNSGKAQPGYHLPLPYEELYVDVGEDGIFQVRYQNPLRIGQTLAASPALLPFNQVLDIFGSVSPLKYASFESADNNGIQIDRIVLGYMNLQNKDQPDRHQMVPVWDFFGTRTIDQERYSFANYALFTINAIDGTVIDRDLGY